MKKDIVVSVTRSILEQLEAGTPPWHRAWAGGGGGGLPRRATGEPYRGVNVFILAMANRPSPHWLTYKQAAAVGGQVRKGERGTGIVFFKPIAVPDRDRDGETKTIPMARGYTVFNSAQCDGLPPRYNPPPAAPRNSGERLADVDTYIANTGAVIRHGGDRAFYRPSADMIGIPDMGQFDDPAAFYATLLHECMHWTGAAARLDRRLSYAEEELVAEMGAALLCATLGVSLTPRPDHAAYIAAWIEQIRGGDNRLIFRAAAAAQRAVDYLDELQQQAAAQRAA
jgi:antirestriction protein ArdC